MTAAQDEATSAGADTAPGSAEDDIAVRNDDGPTTSTSQTAEPLESAEEVMAPIPALHPEPKPEQCTSFTTCKETQSSAPRVSLLSAKPVP